MVRSPRKVVGEAFPPWCIDVPIDAGDMGGIMMRDFQIGHNHYLFDDLILRREVGILLLVCVQERPTRKDYTFGS